MTNQNHKEQIDDERGIWTSASSAEADALCPGRHLACLGLPTQLAGDDADRGTRIHAVLSGDESTKLTDEENDCVYSCRKLEQDIVQEWTKNGECQVIRETRIWADFGNIRHSGKADVVYLDGLRALVLDYKTGRGDVTEPNSNLQLRDLAVLVGMKHGATEVTVAIVQPDAKRQPPCVYDFQALVKATCDLESRITWSNDPNSPRRPGEKQCKYCRAKATCSAFLESSLPVEASKLETPDKVADSIKSLSSAKLGQFLGLLRLAEKVATQEVRSRLTDGMQVEGWALKPGRVTEKITNPQGVFDRATTKGVSLVSFMAAVSVQKTALKSALKEATGAKGKALEAIMDECLAGNVETKQGEPVLCAI